MKNCKRLFVPQGLKEDIHEKVFMYHKKSEQLYYKYVYVIHLLYTHATLYKEDYAKSGVALFSGILNETVGRRDKAKIFLNLQAWGYIRLIKDYCVGEHSRHYKLSRMLEFKKFSTVTVPASFAPFIKKMLQKETRCNNNVIKQQKKIFKDDIRLSEEGLMFIRSKYPALKDVTEAYEQQKEIAEDALADIPIDPEDIILLSFLEKEFFVKRPDKESRIYSNLTCLKREYRKFLLLNGKPLYLTDLINSQIVFSVPVILNHLKMKAGKKECILPEDFLEYKMLAEDGLVYEAIAKEAGFILTKENRTAFKKRFFQEIFFSEVSNRRTKIKIAFTKLFPTVAKAINEIKAKDYTEFPVRLQRMEASVMVKILNNFCAAGVKALSIHDCIVVNNDNHLKRAEQLISNELMTRFGVKAKFKSERTIQGVEPHEELK